MQSIQLATLDVDTLRTRLRKMSDEELRKFGKAARYMVSPTANMSRPPLPAFVLQLEEARAEWRRRCNGHQPERKAGADEKRTTPARKLDCFGRTAAKDASIGHEGEARDDT
jgi:hypothetical protein